MADLGWEDDDVTWGGLELTSKVFSPVFLDGTQFYLLGYDPTTALNAYVERESVVHENGLPLLGTFVWPQILGPDGGIISISLGGAEVPDGAVAWEGPYDFVIGTDTFADFMVEGKYLAIRFESTGIAPWTLQSYSIDYEILGQH